MVQIYMKLTYLDDNWKVIYANHFTIIKKTDSNIISDEADIN